MILFHGQNTLHTSSKIECRNAINNLESFVLVLHRLVYFYYAKKHNIIDTTKYLFNQYSYFASLAISTQRYSVVIYHTYNTRDYEVFLALLSGFAIKTSDAT